MATLAKTSSFPSVRSLMEDFWNTDKFFGKDFFGNPVPAVNVIERENEYEIDLAAPGFKKEDFKVDIDNGMLTLCAETSKSETEENESFTRREFSSSSFTRSFSLPDDVNDGDVNAKYEDGLLKVTLARQAGKVKMKKEIEIA